MNVTNEERDQLRRLGILDLFKEDIQIQQFREMQKLYEAANVTNRMLLDKLHEQHNNSETKLTDSIFVDIGYILADIILERPEIKALFISLYGKRYPDILRHVRSIEKEAAIDRTRGAKILREGASRYIQNDRQGYLFFLFVDSDMIMENEYLPRKNLERQLERVRTYQRSESTRNDQHFLFNSDINKPIFSSNEYKTFVTRQKNALAAYMGVEPEGLNEAIQQMMHLSFDQQSQRYSIFPGDGGIAHMATSGLLQSHHVTAGWMHEMTVDPKILPRGRNYQPDLETIMDEYYHARVMNQYAIVVSDRTGKYGYNGFEKHHLFRDTKATSPREDLLAILYLYQTDIIYKMFSEMREEYYRAFSWEQVTGSGVTERYKSVIQDMNEELVQKDLKISSMERKMATLKAQLAQKDLSDSKSPLALENNRLMKSMDEQAEEMARLREQIQSRDRYIESLLAPEENEEPETVDLTALQGNRYLFVGDAQEALPELRKLFPDSVFMDSVNTRISGIQVSAVVLLIKWTSHAMFYKVKAEPSLRSIPMINVNTKNLNRVLWEMSQQANENVLRSPETDQMPE